LWQMDTLYFLNRFLMKGGSNTFQTEGFQGFTFYHYFHDNSCVKQPILLPPLILLNQQ